MSYECNKILQDTNLLNPLPQGIEPWNVRKAVAQVCPVMDAISFDGLRRRLRRASEEDIIRGVDCLEGGREELFSRHRGSLGRTFIAPLLYSLLSDQAQKNITFNSSCSKVSPRFLRFCKANSACNTHT